MIVLVGEGSSTTTAAGGGGQGGGGECVGVAEVALLITLFNI